MMVPHLRALLLSDDGRIGRQTFWLYLLGCVAFALATLSLPLIGLPAFAPVLISVLLIFPTYCIIAKRLQDIGIPGQWGVFMAGIAAMDAMWIAAGAGARSSLVLSAIQSAWWWLALANTLAFFALGLWPGEKGHNTFGDPPAS